MSAKAKSAGKRPVAKGAKAADDGARPGRIGLRFWVVALCCGAGIALFPGSALMLAGLLLPVILLAMFEDNGDGARLAHIALLFGLAATVHPMLALWSGDAGPVAALAMLKQPTILLPAWMAIFGGWFVSELAALVIRLHADIIAARERRALMAIIDEIEDEWGPMPASAPLPPL